MIPLPRRISPSEILNNIHKSIEQMLFFNQPPSNRPRDPSMFFHGCSGSEDVDGTPPERSVSRAATDARASIEDALSLDGPPDVRVAVGDRVYQYHAGSGYFGLQSHPEVLAATCEATLRYGVGTATSRAAFTSPPVFEVERRIADLFGSARAFYTSSGYIGNQILVDALCGTFDRVFIDEASHHSLFDAARNIRAARFRPIPFKHRCPEDLQEKLDANLRWNERPLVLTDGLFSLVGSIAPVDRYVELLSEYEGASLLVDDAHGIGVLGRSGRGTLEHFGIDPATANRTREDTIDPFGLAETHPVNLYFSLSMSKAVGGYGGVIPGSDTFIERLMERSKVFTGASAPPSPIAAATAKGLAVLFDDSQLRDRLRERSRYLKSRLREDGFAPGDSPVPIVNLTLGSALNMRRVQKGLSERGFLIAYLPRHPGLGSEGTLRIAVFATHTNEMIDSLVEALHDIA
ncbi:MAG TPA: hypothetical protein DEB39_07275 [Planctomycetaceae bacterium]|nr:hypothetical protein [Planctomycetaceae bacterium]